MNPLHLLWIIPVTAAISVPVAYFLLGLLTSAGTTDLDRERWQALCALAVLYHAVKDSGADRGRVDAAMARAREVLG